MPLINLPEPLHNALFTGVLRYQAARRELRRRTGLMRPASVLPYRGYGMGRRVLVKARVIEARRKMPSLLRDTTAGHLIDAVRRYATHELPGVEVRAKLAGESLCGTTNEEGFLDLWLEAPEPFTPGWNDIELYVDTDHTPAHAYVIGPDSEYAVISDVDDTVIDTNVQNRLKRAYALFLASSKTRLPFEGVDAFYRALTRGSSGSADNAIFYVSSSPWNLYEHIVEFLELNDIPPGPILLRDWGISRQGFAPNGRHEHKLERIQEVLDAIEPLQVVLLGDSGQRDPELYTRVARENPGRVRAVFIRNVSHKPAREQALDALRGELEQQGVPFFAAGDSLALARRAAAEGLIAESALAEVRRERDEQREAEPG